MSAIIVHFLPSLFTIKLAIKGPKAAPKGVSEVIHAFSSGDKFNFGNVGEVQVKTHPAATDARLAEK